MSSVGFPVFVVTTLIVGTAAAIVLTPKDVLRATVVEAPKPRYLTVDTRALANQQNTLQLAPSTTSSVQLASLTVSVTPISEPGAARPAAASSADIRTITAGALNMRAEPNKYSDLIASLPRGTRVTVTNTSGTWAYVTAPDGTTGWLSQNFLAPVQ